MCGRFTLKTPAKTLAQLFDDLPFPKLEPRYNIAPTQQVLSVRQAETGAAEAVFLRWGLVPHWAKDLKMGARMINARSETVATKPSFRSAFKSRRCLILADGFFEWKKEGSGKQPYYITLEDESPFCLAGLWESWTDPEAKKEDAEPIQTCTILTTDSNSAISALHDRMPVILGPQQFEFWLDRDFSDRDQLEKALVPYPADEIKIRPVSKWVNKATHGGPECIEEIER